MSVPMAVARPCPAGGFPHFVFPDVIRIQGRGATPKLPPRTTARRTHPKCHPGPQCVIAGLQYVIAGSNMSSRAKPRDLSRSLAATAIFKNALMLQPPSLRTRSGTRSSVVPDLIRNPGARGHAQTPTAYYRQAYPPEMSSRAPMCHRGLQYVIPSEAEGSEPVAGSNGAIHQRPHASATVFCMLHMSRAAAP